MTYTIAARLSGSRTFRAVIGAIPTPHPELAVAQLAAVEGRLSHELAVVELGTTEHNGYPVELDAFTALRVPFAVGARVLIANAERAGELVETLDPGELNEPPAPELDELAPELVVIPCGGQKLDHAAPAAELYVGSYFRAGLAYARAVTGGDDSRIRILSARYGLVALDRVLPPYDTRMGDPDSITPAALLAQAWDHGLIGGDELVTVIGGRAYVDAALSVWPGARTPLAGCAGMGYQLAELARLTRAARELASVTA